MNLINNIKTHLRKFSILPNILRVPQHNKDDYWFNFKQDFMKHLQKYYWVYSILMVIIGISLDYITNTAEICGQEVYTTLLDKTVQKQIIYKYIPSFYIIKVITNILYGTSISLIVLFLIDKRIDSIENVNNKKENDNLRDELNINIFNGVLKKVIPEQLFDKFNKDIFQTDLFIKNAFWTYKITKNKTNSFDVKQSIRYELHNLNDYELKYKLPIIINTNTSYVKTNLTNIEVLNSDKTVQTTFNQTNREVIIKPNNYIEVSMIIDNEYKHTSVLDVHNSMFSIIGLTIETIQPEDISVKITPSFLKEIETINTGLTNITKYKPIDCILQGQGISYLIEPIQQTSTIGQHRILNQ
jgi:hypothetical protein